MGVLVAGEVTIAEDGTASFDPPDPEDSLAGQLYLAEIEATDEYALEEGVEAPPDAERVKLLRWYAKRSNKVAARLAPLINLATGDP